MVGKSVGKQTSKIPLSNNTTTRRIHNIAEDLFDKLIEKIKCKKLDVQLNEATDNNNKMHT